MAWEDRARTGDHVMDGALMAHELADIAAALASQLYKGDARDAVLLAIDSHLQ
jgi:hypothetical protein